MMMPLVHWLPKGYARDHAIKTLLRIGAAAPYFRDHDIDARADIFATFSREETFYRSLSEIRRIFQSHGFACSVTTPSRLKVISRLPVFLAQPFLLWPRFIGRSGPFT